MAQLSELITRVNVGLQDGSFSQSTVTGMLNTGLQYIAGRVLLSRLETTGDATTVTTGNFVDMPTSWTFMRNLFKCEAADKPTIKVVHSIEAIQRAYPSFELDRSTDIETGDIEYVMERQGRLYYYPVPESAQLLTCSFYRAPATMVLSTDTPDGLPLHLQELLLVSYCLWQGYALLEQDYAGKKVNTEYYRGVFTQHMEELEIFTSVGQNRSRPEPCSSWI